MDISTKKLFIFDFDGTLADTILDITASVNFVRQHLDLDPIHPTEVARYIGQGQAYLVKGISSGVDISEEEVIDLYRQHHTKHLLDHVTYYPLIPEFLLKLQELNKECVILSNKFSYYCEEIIEHLQPKLQFKLVLGPDNAGQAKPDPVGIFKALEATEISAADAVMVGDSSYDIDAGKNAGIDTIGCLYGFGNQEYLKQQADLVVERPEDFLGLLT